MHSLGVVHARGGSKRIPRKNIKLLNGYPLIAYIIRAALSSQIDRVIVSTDDSEIAAIAKKFGAEVPFMRPHTLAQDDTPGMEPILHALRWLEANEDYRPDYAAMLQATSPLRTTRNIDEAFELAEEADALSVVSVCPVVEHPFWMKRMNGDGCLTEFMTAHEAYPRRQDLPPLYSLNGAIFLARRGILLSTQSWYTERTYGYVMPREHSLDIDSAGDFLAAERILMERDNG